MIHPEAHAPVRDIPDYEGDRETVYRSLDTLVIPAITIGLDGLRELRRALDEGEAGIAAYTARTGGRDVAPEPGAPLPEACAWHGGEGDGRQNCPGCQEEQDPFGASAFRGHSPGCGCPDCEGARRDAGDPDEGGPVFGAAELRRADAYRDRERADLD